MVRLTLYGAGCERVTRFAKDHFRPSGADGAAVGRRCHCGERTPRTVVKVRWKKSNPVAYSSGWTVSVAAVTAAALHDGLDGLSCLRKICKAHLFVNWACMINADLVAIGHVSASHQIGRIFTMLAT